MGKNNSGEIELVSKEIRIEHKRFYFNLKENQKGRFLKIAEVSGGRSTIIIPQSGWHEFRDMLDSFIDDDDAYDGDESYSEDEGYDD